MAADQEGKEIPEGNRFGREGSKNFHGRIGYVYSWAW